MTALIIALIAAVGIGGGAVIANNSGGGGSTNPPAAAAPDNTAERAAALTPDYSLISALTDTTQYSITPADTGSLLAEYNRQVHSGVIQLSGATEKLGHPASEVYDFSGRDLREDGFLEGKDFDLVSGGQGTATLNIRAGVDQMALATRKIVGLDANNQLTYTLQNYTLTAADTGVHHTNARWTSFEKADDVFVYPWGGKVYHYNAVHLGGARTGLTVGDFGRWEDTEYFTDSNDVIQGGDAHYQTFMFFDDSFAYKGTYNGPNELTDVPLRGLVMTDEARPYSGIDSPDRGLYAGDIEFHLNLANNTLTGNVDMGSQLPASYSFDFTGSLDGSLVKIDGTGWNNTLPEAGVSRGGMGKLLIGKYGLEIVGNMGVQVEMPTDEYIQNTLDNGGNLRDAYDRGSIDYTFGAKEVLP